MANLTDITTCTDAVLDIYLRTKGGEDNVDCESLTVGERRQLADLMGWERTAFVSSWILDAPKPAAEVNGYDYEGAIMARQDREVGMYL